MKEFWDERYSAEEFTYGRQPNHFFKQYIDQLKPGKVLLPCEGEGRNAVYAASQGWEVVAFDQSAVGKTKALALAQETGVSIDFLVADAAEFDYAAYQFDLIAFLWAHFPASIRRNIHHKSLQGLKDGGILMLEGFNKKQLSFTSGGPKDPSMLFSLDYFPEEFPGLTTLELEEKRIFLDEGEFHKGEAEVLRFIGKKG